MQLKLLNFHKIISQFATNILGAFVALIIYQSTGNFTWAFAYLTALNILKIIFTRIFYHIIQNKPQLILLIRIIPFLIYSVSILLLDTEYQIFAIILILVFQSLSEAFRELPHEYVFNYSVSGNVGSLTGVTRFFDYFGVIIAILIGGLFLDNLSKWVVVCVSCFSYLISVIPLFIYYFKRRHNTGFNKDSVSDAVISYKEIKIKKHQLEILRDKVLRNYFFVYFFICIFDSLMNVFSLYLFKVSAESYSFSAYIQMAYNGLFGLGCLFVGRLEDRIDLTKIVVYSCLFSALLVMIVPFVVNIIYIEIALFGALGFLYSFISIFCYSRMTTRCKILGVNNKALYNRTNSSRYSRILIDSLCMFGPFMLVPSFFIMGGASIFCAYFIPKKEEQSRQYIVDFLQNNKMY
ncbi:MAG: MFS transporter [Clostridia bacterium]|nr:MFS transporter [Clostridia bacterium]